MNNQEYVTFETAQLLKKAGYPQNNFTSWYSADKSLLCKNDGYIPIMEQDLAAPHLWDAMKWLREEKRISVEVTCIYDTEYCVDVYVITDVFCDETTLIKSDAPFIPTYEAACDAGIAAACQWLLGKKHSEKA